MTGCLEITEHLKDYMEKERIGVKCYEDGIVYIDSASQKETAQVMSYLRSGNSRQWKYLNSNSNPAGHRWYTIAYFERVTE
jgi:hypothetical protein